MFIYAWRDIDINDPELSKAESLALRRMMQKMAQYIEQGRSHDAHGAGTAILIAFHCLKGFDPYADESSGSAQVPL